MGRSCSLSVLESLKPEQQREFPAWFLQHRRMSRITSSHKLSMYLLAAGRRRSKVIYIHGIAPNTTHKHLKYLANTSGWRTPAFDKDLSAAFLKIKRIHILKTSFCRYLWNITSKWTQSDSHLCSYIEANRNMLLPSAALF